MKTVKVAKKDVDKFNKILDDFGKWMKKVTPKDEFCKCGGFKMLESDFCKDCV